MTVGELLNAFYKANGLPEDGGVNDDTFQMNVFSVNVTLPNPTFRKKLTLIHDIQHVLNDCDTSWKGEGFICGWEIATGLWKHFPICLFSLWAFGYVLWFHPKAVFEGFKKGLNDNSIIDLKVSESDFMKMEFQDLVSLTKKEKYTPMGILQWFSFLFWVFVSEIIFLFPLLVVIIGLTVF